MKPLLMLPSKSYYETEMVRAIDSGAETTRRRDQNGNQRYHFGPGVAGQHYPPPELPWGKTGLGHIYPRGKSGLGQIYPLQATFTPPDL